MASPLSTFATIVLNTSYFGPCSANNASASRSTKCNIASTPILGPLIFEKADRDRKTGDLVYAFCSSLRIASKRCRQSYLATNNIKYTRNRRDGPFLLNRVHLCYSWILLSVPAGGGSGRERCMCAIGRLLDDAATCFFNWSGFISATRGFCSRYLRAAGVDASVVCGRSEGFWTTPRRASSIGQGSSPLLGLCSRGRAPSSSPTCDGPAFGGPCAPPPSVS